MPKLPIFHTGDIEQLSENTTSLYQSVKWYAIGS